MKIEGRSIKALCLVCMVSGLLAGCGGQAQYDKLDKICLPETSKAGLMAAAERVLADMYFKIDKADIEDGFIRTRPLSGAQFFEFWRSDNIDAANTAQSNMHSIRRIVVLNISDEAQPLCVDCTVHTQRLSLPSRNVTTNQTYALFTKSGSSMQKLRLDPGQKAGMSWVDLGTDSKLETEILNRIKSLFPEQKELDI